MADSRQDDARHLIDDLLGKGGRLRTDGERLCVSAPPGVITNEIAAALKARKTEILAILRDADSIPHADRTGPIPLGIVQERMWAHSELDPRSLVYNLPAAWKFSGPFEIEAFRAAFADFVARHEVMRTRISTIDGAPRQKFDVAQNALPAVEDLASIADAAARARRVAERIEALRTAEFDLQNGEPYFARLFRLSAVEHVLFFMPHHVIWDGWCFDIFLRDMREFYLARIEGRAPVLPKLTAQYADYSTWHRARTEAGAFSDDLDYWANVLSNPPAPPSLPEDLARPQLFSADGDWTGFDIDAGMLANVRALAGAERATSFMAFLCLWRAFLGRITGESDIVIGAPVQARQHADIGEVAGCFVNTMFMRHKINSEKSISELLRETREVCLAAYARQEAPVELLIDRLAPHRDPSRTPLAQVMFSHQQVSRRPDDFGKALISQVHVNPRISPTDIMFAVMERADTARAVFHYSAGVFSENQIDNIRRAFEAFVNDALARPRAPAASLALMNAVDYERMAIELNATDSSHDPAKRAHDLISEAAARAPDKVAVVTSQSETTFGALEARADRLAHWLRSLGVEPGDIVGLMPPRGVDLIALPLAVWRCGGAYLPLDPAYPDERLRFMLEDSGARLFVSATDIAALSESPPVPRANLDEAVCALEAAPAGFELHSHAERSRRAYVIYTSGSTGRPKGVENSHGALSNFLRAMLTAPGIGSADRLLAVTTLAFDISILELFAPLVAGGCVILATADEAVDGETLARMLCDHEATIMQATPATWRLLIDSGFGGSRRLKALCGGEALSPALAESLLQRVGELWNMYGPTETTVWSTCKKISAPTEITIGRPIANTRLYVVGDSGALMPPGISGELWIGGEGVAIGYLNRADLTADRFVHDPFSGGAKARAYRTGDLARVLSNGEVAHLGRIDAQVKLRGFRIELGEIESALEQHEAVARAVAAVKSDAAGAPMLIAYLQYADGNSVTGSDLRRWLRRSLPNYMLPQLFVEIESIPLTGSGKVDRKCLPDPGVSRDRRSARIAPRNDMEEAIARIWREILSIAEISVTDNFFELGGQSLQAAQMAARVRDRTGRRISPRAVIFESLEQLAAGSQAVAASAR